MASITDESEHSTEKKSRSSKNHFDQVLSGVPLYIGGLRAFNPGNILQKAHITHVLSVYDGYQNPIEFEGIHRLHICVKDVPATNLLQYFGEVISFIDTALISNGSVLVHCAAGKSRSSTCVIAYMLFKFPKMSPRAVLKTVRKSRRCVDPNRGFWEQLTLFHEMKTPLHFLETEWYQRWSFEWEEKLRKFNLMPRPSSILFPEPENWLARVREEAISNMGKQALCCESCNCLLIPYPLLEKCTSLESTDGTSGNYHPGSKRCDRTFVKPLSWMYDEMAKNWPMGWIKCPECKKKVGSYDWIESKCGCGKIAVRALSIMDNKVRRSIAQPWMLDKDQLRPRHHKHRHSHSNGKNKKTDLLRLQITPNSANDQPPASIGEITLDVTADVSPPLDQIHFVQLRDRPSTEDSCSLESIQLLQSEQVRPMTSPIYEKPQLSVPFQEVSMEKEFVIENPLQANAMLEGSIQSILSPERIIAETSLLPTSIGENQSGTEN